MYDYEKVAAAIIKYHEDFRPDFQTASVAPARVFEKLGLKLVDWPGGGLADDTPWQYLEAEYMREDEYDALIADPEVYFRRSLLPRFGSAFASLAASGSLHRHDGSHHHALQHPAVRRPGGGRGGAAAGRRRP